MPQNETQKSEGTKPATDPAGAVQSKPRKISSWVFALVKIAIGVAIVALPPIYPHLLESSDGKSLSGWAYFFVLLIVVSSIWEAIVKGQDDQRAEERAEEADKRLVTATGQTVLMRAEHDREIKSLTTQLQQVDFFRDYTGILQSTVEITSQLADMTRDELEQAIFAGLQNIEKIVRSFTRQADGEIIVSYMYGEPFSLERALALSESKSLHFFDIDRPGDYSHLLVTRNWSSHDTNLPEDFSLPVHRQKSGVLFGAPTSFQRRGVRTISDVKNVVEMRKFMSNLPEWIKRRAEVFFFDECEYASFASIPLKKRRTSVGVLNISSTTKDAFGNMMNTPSEMRSYIDPLISMVAKAAQLLEGKRNDI